MREATVMILGVVLAGCSSAKQVRFTIRPAADMNDVRSCYLLARAVDPKAFTSESYDDVAAKAMTPDDSVLSSVAVLPGVTQAVTVPAPEKGRIAIYALFKQPEDETWRLLLPAAAPEKVELRLGRGRMCWASDKAPKGAAGLCAQGRVEEQKK